MDSIFFIIGIIFFIGAMVYFTGGAQQIVNQNRRCNEIRQPHAWEWCEQPGFEFLLEKDRPVYLKCKKCGYIFGNE